jgi:cyanophycin synthetase
VERFIAGNEHRLLVVAGKVVAAARGESAFVIGDGISDLHQLIESQLNSDPRRGVTEEFPLNIITLEEDHHTVLFEIERQGYTPTSIPAAGVSVLIQRNGNVAFDVTDLVHPDVAADAALAARIVGLDIAGIDLVAEDISKPLAEQGGAIVEVNAGPGLLMHLNSADGSPRPVGDAIVASLFNDGDDGRIPIVGVSGTHGCNEVAHIISVLVQLSGLRCGLACADGHYLGRRQVETGDRATWTGGHKLLLNPAVDVAVIQSKPQGILHEGLPYDRSQVAVLTHLDQTCQLPDYYVTTPDQLFNVLRTVVDVVLASGVAVLNADDEKIADMAPLCDGSVIFFGLKAEQAILTEHRAKGGRAVFVQGQQVILANGSEETALIVLSAIPQIEQIGTEHLIAAVAAAWALNISNDVIRAGIETLRLER